MLLPQAGWGRVGGGDTIAFMPHFESAERGAWVEAAAEAGIELIDPRGDPAAIIAAIGRCRVLLSEAMHGVIVADALRVPWIAVQPLVAAASREMARLGRHAGPSHRVSPADPFVAAGAAACVSARRAAFRLPPVGQVRFSVWAPDARSAGRAGRAIPGRRRRRRAAAFHRHGTGPVPDTDVGAPGGAAARSPTTCRLAAMLHFRVPRLIAARGDLRRPRFHGAPTANVPIPRSGEQ